MKKTLMKSRILTMLLAFAVALSFMGFEFAAVPAYAEDENAAMTVNLGTDALEDPEVGGNVKSIVYFGKYDSAPTKYLVLDSASADYGSDDSVFLVSKKDLFTRAFGTTNDWSSSDVCEYLNNKFLSDNFTAQEQAAIIESVKTDGEAYVDDLFGYEYPFAPLEGDKLFILSVDEFRNANYGSIEGREYEGFGTGYSYTTLRSPQKDANDYVATSTIDSEFIMSGAISNENNEYAPAMNIDSSKVFMTVANDYDKTALAAPAATESNEWKFTLEDESQTVDVTKCTVEGNKASVTYDYSGEGATQLSLLVENADGEIVEYGKVADIDAGTATFDLPEGFDPANDSACVFAEQVNGAGYTDYAGTPVELDIEEQPEGPVDFFDPDVWPEWATKADELDGSEVLIDVRPYATYVKGHLPGSINCPVSNPYTPAEQAAIAKVYDDNKDAESIVIVCVSGNMLAKNALSALQAAEKDMSIVTYLQGGANGVKDKWVTNDGAVSEKAPVIGEAKARTMTTVIDMSSAERYGKGDVVEVWVPVPQTDELQTIKNEKLVAEKAEKAEFTVSEDHGNKMA
ncbi:MAG: rhodanese-like domain-containing protein, partial [Clostridiales bacterium]|nr:rhodanese-like domain-containing protein [Clostridiales bacterium]